MNDELLAVTLARIEGKLDLVNAGLTAATNRGDDHEARIRALEAQPIVTPRAMWTAVGCIATVVGAAAPFLAVLFSK